MSIVHISKIKIYILSIQQVSSLNNKKLLSEKRRYYSFIICSRLEFFTNVNNNYLEQNFYYSNPRYSKCVTRYKNALLPQRTLFNIAVESAIILLNNAVINRFNAI
jgi:hypothetical protein